MKPKLNLYQGKGWRVFLIGTVLVGALFLFFLALGLSLRRWLPEQPAEASIRSDTESSTPNSESQDIKSFATAAVVNGIEVRISNIRRDDTKLSVDVCFDLPDGADWTLHEPSLAYAENRMRYSETIPISLSRIMADGTLQVIFFEPDGSHSVSQQKAEASTIGSRCDTVVFDSVSSAGQTPSFTIPAIAAEPREGDECSPANLSKYFDAITTRFEGVKVECNTSTGFSRIEVNKAPVGIAASDIEAFTGSEEFYLDIHGIRGPWVFDLPIQ